MARRRKPDTRPIDPERADAEGTPERRALTETETRRLQQHFSAEITTQVTLRAGLEDRWAHWLELYRPDPAQQGKKSYPWPGASNVSVGLTAIYVDSIVARILQTIFQIDPHWVVKPLSRPYSEGAKPLETYLDWLRQHAWNQYHVVKPMLLEMCKLGTGMLATTWHNDPIVRMNETSGELQQFGRRVGPRTQWVPREDFLMPVGFSRINVAEDGPKAPWVAYRQRLSRPTIEQLHYTGFFAGDLAKVLKHPDNEQTRLDQVRQRTADSWNTPADSETGGLWSLWQVWFQWDLDEDGYPEEYVLTIHPATQEIVRFRPNPYLDGMRPFVAARFIEDQGQFDGIGVPEMVEQYQEEVSTIHNQRRDNAHIANTKMFAARRGSGVTEKVKIYPGKVWLLSDPQDIREIAMGQNYLSTIQEEQVSIAMAERRVGISDVNLGRESSPLGRAAATTVMALLQEGSRRFDLNTSELRRALGEQAWQVIEMFQTHGLPAPADPGSPEAVLAPEEAAAVRALLDRDDDVRGLVGLDVNVATQAVNREAEKQANVQLFQLVSAQYYQPIFQLLPMLASPQAPPEVRQIAVQMVQGADVFLRRLFQQHQLFDLEGLLLGEQLAALVAAVPQTPPLMAGMGAGGPPGAGAGNGQMALPGLTEGGARAA